MRGKRRTWRKLIAIMLGVLMLGGLSNALVPRVAAQSDTPSEHVITVNGEGEASAMPDVAYVTVGVQTQNETAAAAVGENSRAMTAVLDAMRARGLASRDLQTTGLSVSPQFDRQQQITG